MRAQRSALAIARAKSFRAIAWIAEGKNVQTTLPMSLELAQVLHGERAQDHIRAVHAQLTAIHEQGSAANSADFEVAQSEQREANRLATRALDQAVAFFFASALSAAIGIIWVPAEHLWGERLQAASAVASMAPVVDTGQARTQAPSRLRTR